MTRTLILHIGHYKTGTTALQVFCAQNARGLARQGIAYAQTAQHLAKHSDLAFALLRAAGAKTLMWGYDRPDPPEAVWAPLLAEVRAAATPAVLASSEEFMRLALFPQAEERLAAILAGAPDIRLRVVAYLRPVGPHLRAWHNQLVKTGQCLLPFQTAVCTLFEPIHYDYALALAPWARLAGAGNLMVRPYDDGLRQGDRLYADFCAALGIDLPARPALPEKDPNPRLDDRLLDLARTARAERLDGPRIAELLDQARRWLDRRRHTAEAQAPDFAALRGRAEAALAQVAAMAGPDFPLAAFRQALPEPSPPAELDREALVAFLMHGRAELEREVARLSARLAELEAAAPAALAGRPDPPGA